MDVICRSDFNQLNIEHLVENILNEWCFVNIDDDIEFILNEHRNIYEMYKDYVDILENIYVIQPVVEYHKSLN